MIALCFKVVGTPVGFGFGGVSVAVDHQHRDTPDVDLPYHARKGSKASVSKFLTEEIGLRCESGVTHRLLLQATLMFAGSLWERKRPSGSVHARARRLQAVDRG
jgi:hypothetical protein